MKTSAIKKSDGKIWLVHGDHLVVMETGDTVIELPLDWEAPNAKYRDAWREKGGEITVDLPAARLIKLAEIRIERDKRLADSDKEWLIAMSQGKSQDEINTKKKALRDIPDVAESALKKLKKLETIDAYSPEWP